MFDVAWNEIFVYCFNNLYLPLTATSKDARKQHLTKKKNKTTFTSNLLQYNDIGHYFCWVRKKVARAREKIDKISHNFATALPIDVMFGASMRFSGSADLMVQLSVTLSDSESQFQGHSIVQRQISRKRCIRSTP